MISKGFVKNESPFKWPQFAQYLTNNQLWFRENREAKRGGTAPGEQRVK